MSSFHFFFVISYHTIPKKEIQSLPPDFREADGKKRNFFGKAFDISSVFLYHGLASKLDSRAGGAKGPQVRKVRAPQGKDNG